MAAVRFVSSHPTDRGHLVAAQTESRSSFWTFLTNHAHVLVCVAEDPDIRGRDIATRVGITERAAQAIITDLVDEGYVTRTKVGRRNHYTIDAQAPLRHPLEEDHTIGEILVTLGRLKPRRVGTTGS